MCRTLDLRAERERADRDASHAHAILLDRHRDEALARAAAARDTAQLALAYARDAYAERHPAYAAGMRTVAGYAYAEATGWAAEAARIAGTRR